MATIGLPKSASVMPVARQRERAPAMLRPWVEVRLRYPLGVVLMAVTLPDDPGFVQPPPREAPDEGRRAPSTRKVSSFPGPRREPAEACREGGGRRPVGR